MSSAHEATAKDRRTVEAMAAAGIQRSEIAGVLGISNPTLRKHYEEQLTTGPAKANAKVAERLFAYATGKNGTSREQLTAAIFWAKTRMGWCETVRVAQPDGKPLPPAQIVNIYIPHNKRDDIPKPILARMGSDNGAGS